MDVGGKSAVVTAVACSVPETYAKYLRLTYSVFRLQPSAYQCSSGQLAVAMTVQFIPDELCPVWVNVSVAGAVAQANVRQLQTVGPADVAAAEAVGEAVLNTVCLGYGRQAASVAPITSTQSCKPRNSKVLQSVNRSPEPQPSNWYSGSSTVNLALNQSLIPFLCRASQ